MLKRKRIIFTWTSLSLCQKISKCFRSSLPQIQGQSGASGVVPERSQLVPRREHRTEGTLSVHRTVWVISSSWKRAPRNTVGGVRKLKMLCSKAAPSGKEARWLLPLGCHSSSPPAFELYILIVFGGLGSTSLNTVGWNSCSRCLALSSQGVGRWPHRGQTPSPFLTGIM